MKIKYKIALYYTLSAALLLVAFATLAYYLSAKSRQQEYLERLEYRARSIASVVLEGNIVKVELLRELDRTTFQDLYKEAILVYNTKYDVLYSNIKDTAIRTNRSLLDHIVKYKFYSNESAGREVVGVFYTEEQQSVIVLVSSFDKYGFQNLQSLEQILIIELAVAVIILIAVGYFFAKKMMKPVDQLVQQVDSINANNLQDKRVAVKGRDEIAQLGANFNTMLQRLSSSFDLQKSFVSNASHELRTPLAAMISQLQVILSKEREKDDYIQTLNSVLEEAENLSDLTNGLLQLAQSDLGQQKLIFSPVRIDELLLEMGNLVRMKNKSSYKIELRFLKEPEQDTQVTCLGNESLLKVLFINLLDNACKFSADNTASVSIDFYTRHIMVQVQDNGIGIPSGEVSKIFEPFYRANNAQQVRGHGLGLSICKKIVQIHQGHISVSSDEGRGTIFTVLLPQLPLDVPDSDGSSTLILQGGSFPPALPSL
ncbi:HAMP domain-containing protein [Chitinophaga pendula]|uniref:sensor histidine kinase n=1 Tax=Chitinophaga TaxID=79328 RepID=UPI000BAFF16E|nr:MULTISPECIES: sensor histidine kinase [Chitinophaga]ASZ13093.1 two-component sensor histidine kinase [Chitinophaga sp. MD30]UCJ09286.1 HAMP domain-containing protein [Chitinophaga pendula]